MKPGLTCSRGIVLSWLLLFLGPFLLYAAENSDCLGCENQNYIKCLETQSMLYQASTLAREYSGQGKQWQHAYAKPQPSEATRMAAVWFTAYPTATITPPGQTILQSLGDRTLWKTFQEIGIRAMHTGPVRRAGGVRHCQYTPSVDGGFDRISLDIDPSLGTAKEYINMVETAEAHQAHIVGDIVPGHTGKGPDFRLAERNYQDYPGIYHMVEIKEKHWDLLGEVNDGKDSVNLKCSTVEALAEKGYIVGALERVIFYEKGVKDTNWSATDKVVGVDGVERRWVYLHYFKDGEPTLNWLDPSFAAQRLIIGDILKSKEKLGAKILRLDANGFLGIEKSRDRKTKCEIPEEAWSEGHPLSIVSNEAIAMLMRKFAGFTFQELNLTLEDIKKFSEGASDLSYDFITRPAFVHALITGRAEFLRLMMRLMHEHHIDPVSLIHGLQNHDELTYELVHLVNHNEDFSYDGNNIKGPELANEIRQEAYDKVTITLTELKNLTEAEKKQKPWWNIEGWNGICGTMTGIIAAALRNELGIEDPYHMNNEQKEQVNKAHLLLVMFNAMQPGVLAISGWDLVGALPLTKTYLQETDGPINELLKDGDCRWLNRGAYDLTGTNPDATKTAVLPYLPKADTIYGTLPEQLKDPGSFVSGLKSILEIRNKYKIHLAKQILPQEVSNDGVVLLINKPNKPGEWLLQITAINFGSEKIREIVKIKKYIMGDIKGLKIENLLTMQSEGEVDESGEFTIVLGAREGKLLLFKN